MITMSIICVTVCDLSYKTVPLGDNNNSDLYYIRIELYIISCSISLLLFRYISVRYNETIMLMKELWQRLIINITYWLVMMFYI